jgi:hypothetical protein
MSISNISSTNHPFLSTVQNGVQQRRSDFKALGEALSSGDLDGAKQAFEAVISDQKKLVDTISSRSKKVDSTASSGDINEAVQQRHADFVNLGKSLGAGDISGAQEAFKSVLADQKNIASMIKNQYRQDVDSDGTVENDGDADDSVGTSLNVTA